MCNKLEGASTPNGNNKRKQQTCVIPETKRCVIALGQLIPENVHDVCPTSNTMKCALDGREWDRVSLKESPGSMKETQKKAKR